MEQERGTGRNKRTWSEKEDEKLIDTLLDLVNKGVFKADNGFKPGYLKVLENTLSAQLPESGIKVKPHIESRIKILKRDFSTIYDMINGSTSGFGWWDGTRLLLAANDVWIIYIKVYPHAAQWRKKIFPRYDDLAVIFGIDRATGKDAQTAADVVEEIEQEEQNEGGGDENSYMPSNAPTTGSERSQKNNKKRNRNVDLAIECMTQTSTLIVNELKEASERFSRAIGVEYDLMQQKKQINDVMDEIVGIPNQQRFQAARKIASDENLMVLFFTTRKEKRDEFVAALLRGEL